MTVKELRVRLAAYPDDLVVFLALDRPGITEIGELLDLTVGDAYNLWLEGECAD